MTYDAEVLADTPAVFFKHAEPSGSTMEDDSGNNRDGAYTLTTLAQASLLSSDVQTCAQMTSGSANGQVAYGSWMNAASISVEAWVKIAATGAVRIIMCRDIQSGTRVWQLQVNAAGKVVFTGLGAGLPTLTSTAGVADNNPHHIVATYDDPAVGNSVIRIYIDGVLDSTSGTSAGTNALPQPTATPITIGNTNRTTTSVLNGYVQKSAFYTHVLSATRVAVHYAAAFDPHVPEDVTATPISSSDIRVGWDPPSTGPTPDHYEVRINGGAPTSDAASPFTYSGLTPGVEYTFEVRSVGALGGVSDWVLVTGEIPIPTPPDYYRMTLTVGALSWTVEDGDVVDDADLPYPFLPLSFGWSIPDNVDYFPAQTDPPTATFGLVSIDPADLADVAIGDTVTIRLYADADPDADPWQTFDGIVSTTDGEFRTLTKPDGSLVVRWVVAIVAMQDVMRLDAIPIGYTGDWPEESIEDRLDRIATEAGVSLDNVPAGTGQGGILPSRAATSGAISAYIALRNTLQWSAIENTSEPPDTFYGRDVFGYVHADTEIVVRTMERRTYETGLLDAALVETAGRWAKLPGPQPRTWVIVDTNEYGTPDGTPPIVVKTNLVDTSPTNFSEPTRDNLGASLLPDGSDDVDGWHVRTIRYFAHANPDPVGPSLTMAHGWASWAPMLLCLPVFVTPLHVAYQLNGADYIGGLLTGARVVIPPGGKFYLDLRLRPEVLPGTDLPV